MSQKPPAMHKSPNAPSAIGSTQRSARRQSPAQPPKPHSQKCGGGFSRVIRCTGGISRAFRHAKMPIRRIALVHPPLMSAENLHKLQKLRIKKEHFKTLFLKIP
jgi:hypothetical protein